MAIKKYREAVGMSQEALAKASGVSRVSILRYEAGERIPTLTIASKIANVLGCSLDDLISRDADEKK